MEQGNTNNPAVAKSEEYHGSVLRIVNFIDNFTDFMYHNIGTAVKNSPDDAASADLKAFLTSLRKEIADFQAEVETLKNKFDL